MSASNQKKIRKQEREVYKSERERQEALEAKKLRKQTIAFVVVIAICLSIFLGSLLQSPVKNVIYRNTVAVTVGDHELTATDVNYFYVDAINNYVNQYYYYIYLGYIKLDMAKPLSSQVVDSTTGETWAESFLEMAVENIKSTYGLYDLAKKAGHTLTADEQKELDELEGSLKDNAKKNNFNSVNAMLQSTYGNGAKLDTYLAYYEICTYANSYYTAYQDALDYTSEDLREFEGKETYKYNSYTYASYLINVDLFLPKLEKDQKHTDEQIKAAEEAAKKLADELAAGNFSTLEEFDAAIDAAIKEVKGENKTEEENKGTETQTEGETTENEEVTEDEETTEGEDSTEEEKPEEDKKPDLKYTSTKTEDTLYASVSTLFKDWLIGKIASEETEDDKKEETEKDEEEDVKFETRNEGDMTVIEYTTGSGDTKTIKGYYVVRYGSCNDNSYALANIRHVLVKFQGGKTNSTTGQTTYTEAEKKAAKEKAEQLLSNWIAAGKLDEDSFAELARKNSEDGNAAEGGLYEDVYPGQMVTNFNNWCFAKGDYSKEAPRQAGHYTTKPVETEYGYHLIFYVGDSETTYRDYMVTNDKKEADMTKWFEDIIKDSDYVEKTLKYVNLDMILAY